MDVPIDGQPTMSVPQNGKYGDLRQLGVSPSTSSPSRSTIKGSVVDLVAALRCLS